MANNKKLETAVAVGLADELLGAAHTERHGALRALEQSEHWGKVEALVDLAAELDGLAESQARDARQLAGSLERYAERLLANPSACVSNPVAGSLVLQLTERAAKIESLGASLVTLARAMLGAGAVRVVTQAMRDKRPTE